MTVFMPEHLGDGLYVELQDDLMVRLWTPREHGTHEVFMEPQALVNFHHWLMRMTDFVKAKTEEHSNRIASQQEWEE